MNKDTRNVGDIEGRGTGLLPLPPKAPGEAPDFSHDAVFGAAPREVFEAQEQFVVGEVLAIKDQGRKDFCGGYAGAAVREDQEGIELNGDFLFMAAKKLKGGDAWKSWGVNLRDIGLAATKVGVIQQDEFPFLHDDRADDRDFLANPENWPEDSFVLAEAHLAASFFDVDGPYDTFDNIRSTIWMHRMEQRSVLTGVFWRWAWSRFKDGVIPAGSDWSDDRSGQGHAIKVIGWTTIEGTPFLVVVNSWGEDVGDKGLFYFPREVVNKEFVYGSYTFLDMPRDRAEYYLEYGIRQGDNLLVQFFKVFAKVLTRLFTNK